MNTFTVYTGGLLLPLAEYGRNLTLVVMTSGSFQYFTGGGSLRMGSGNFCLPVMPKNEIDHVSAI